MKKLQIAALVLLAGLSIAAVGTAALSSLSMDRNISGGKVLVDTDENVAVQITNISDYDGLVKTDANGKVSFYLDEAISGDSGTGFNTDALYNIGSKQDGVIKIRNNSDVPVTVSMNSSDGNSISLLPVEGSGSRIDVGTAASYYFVVNTQGQKAGSTLNAVLHIEGSN